MEKNWEAGTCMICAVVAHCIADWQSSVALQLALVFVQQPWLPNALNTSPSVSVYYDNVVWVSGNVLCSLSHYLPWSSSCLQDSPWWGWCDREPSWGSQRWGGRQAQRTNSDGSTEPREEQSYVIIRLDWCVATQVRNCTWYQSMGDPRNSHPDTLVGRGSHFYWGLRGWPLASSWYPETGLPT